MTPATIPSHPLAYLIIDGKTYAFFPVKQPEGEE